MLSLAAIALGRHQGKQNIESFFKVSQVHPIEQQRQSAQYMDQQQSLLKQHGYGPEDDQQAIAENEEYYRRLRQLYDEIYGAATGSDDTAHEKATQVLSVPR